MRSRAALLTVVAGTAEAVGPGSTAARLALPSGRYRFRVAATTKAGTGASSSYPSIVTAR